MPPTLISPTSVSLPLPPISLTALASTIPCLDNLGYLLGKPFLIPLPSWTKLCLLGGLARIGGGWDCAQFCQELGHFGG